MKFHNLLVLFIVVLAAGCNFQNNRELPESKHLLEEENVLLGKISYCSKTLRECMVEDKAVLCDLIYVFDWEGNPVKRLNLNLPVIGFCLSSDGSGIFAVVQQPDPTILKLTAL